MTEMLTQFAGLLETASARLTDISASDAALQPSPGRWSRKEILGHLIDSAANNHQRFVRAQLASPLAFPEYEQEGWVRVQAYATESWPDLVNLWLLLNRHLLHVLKAMPEAALANEISIGGKPPVTLSTAIEGYLSHLHHHLAQIIS
jgi:hypothetical protein